MQECHSFLKHDIDLELKLENYKFQKTIKYLTSITSLGALSIFANSVTKQEDIYLRLGIIGLGMFIVVCLIFYSNKKNR